MRVTHTAISSGDHFRRLDHDRVTTNTFTPFVTHRVGLDSSLHDKYTISGLKHSGTNWPLSVWVKSDDIPRDERLICCAVGEVQAGLTERVILRKLAATDPEGKRHIIRMLSHFEYRGHLCLV